MQKYIERPLLIRGRKFDIRSYALVTPDKRVYFHEESYVRTSGVAFSLNDLEDRCSSDVRVAVFAAALIAGPRAYVRGHSRAPYL